jgi:hypothetical protein
MRCMSNNCDAKSRPSCRLPVPQRRVLPRGPASRWDVALSSKGRDIPPPISRPNPMRRNEVAGTEGAESEPDIVYTPATITCSDLRPKKSFICQLPGSAPALLPACLRAPGVAFHREPIAAKCLTLSRTTAVPSCTLSVERWAPG